MDSITEESFPFHYSLLEYLFTLAGFFFFLLDIALDIRNVVSFYQNGDYVYMAVMIFLLLGSSVLLQVFSWLWYSDCLDELETKVETFANKYKLIKPFHFLQLGVFLRYAGVIEISTTLYFQQRRNTEGVALYLNLDLQMLRMFEAFSESAPQLILMMSIILQRGKLELITGLKILTSALAIAFTIALPIRTFLHAFLQEKFKMSWISTGVYFLCNLLLTIPRVTALALFCTVLPCYIIAHFLSLWMLLVLGVWSQKIDYMKSPGWEWLFRATVGLVWYFSWFKVSTGNINLKTVLYYCVMGLDTLMLLGFWWWKVFEYTGCWSSLNPYIVIPILLGLYISGIVLKFIYYRWFHPNYDEQKIPKPSEQQNIKQATAFYADSLESLSEGTAAAPAQPVTCVLNRKRAITADFSF
ncbi:XK-related protein 8-like [Megalobrama amblycephala]|uniref:XK-related protein 8-like n=1 Tax=Megalobrama amblycephala TaxID=75352 RepID=UPI0020146A07|nr:XK-related protein 8-like [Megalobrama amblycephala]XP_048057083.1 XK-related protein 8-like [Megalobrama amblycephala]